MSKKSVKEVLTRHRNVAIVGLSRNPSKDSHRVAAYLKEHGFRIVPVNPSIDEVLGEKSYRSLLEMPVAAQKAIEIVDIFRPASEVLPIVEQAVELKEIHGVPHVIWMQLGITNDQAANVAKRACFTVIMDRCMMREHQAIIEKEAA